MPELEETENSKIILITRGKLYVTNIKNILKKYWTSAYGDHVELFGF